MNIYSAKFSQDKFFYVYEYLRSRKSKYGDIGSSYYVGKGKEKRVFDKNHTIKPPNDKNRIKISVLMTEADAFQLEMLLIHLYGRIDLGTGCLRNLTDGGEGFSGLIHTPESNIKRSKTLKGRILGPQSPEHKLKNSLSHIGQKSWNIGKKTTNRTVETRLKMSLSHKGQIPWNKGIPMTEEAKQKLSNTTKGRIGWPHTTASKEKISKARIGKIPWNKGIKILKNK